MPEIVFVPVNQARISTFSPESLAFRVGGGVLGGAIVASQAFATGSFAVYQPVEIFEPVTIFKMATTNGATVAGNIDLGIYNSSGVKLVSSGSVIHSGTAGIQVVDIADTELLPGLYYMALAFSNITGTFAVFSEDAGIIRSSGVFQQGNAFPLPDIASFSAYNVAFVPIISMSRHVVF